MDTKEFLSIHQIADTNSDLGPKSRERGLRRIAMLLLEGLAPAVLLVVILVLAAALAANS